MLKDRDKATSYLQCSTKCFHYAVVTIKVFKALFIHLHKVWSNITSSPMQDLLVWISAEPLMRSESVWWLWCWYSSIWPVDLGAVCVIFGLWPRSKAESVEVSAWVCMCVCVCTPADFGQFSHLAPGQLLRRHMPLSPTPIEHTYTDIQHLNYLHLWAH